MTDQNTGASPARNEEARFTVSVIIPTRDRPGDLHHCLKCIARSCRTGLVEVILVDDASRERVTPWITLPEGVALRVIRNAEPRGAAASRNAAAAVASGDALAFLDDDTRISSNWFRVVQRELSANRGAITGPVQGFDRCVVARARQRRFDQRYRGLATGEPVEFLGGGNSVVWSEAFRRAGGFPMIPTASDNALLPRMRGIGLRCHFVHEMMVAHRNCKGLRSAVACAFRAGAVSTVVAALARPVGAAAASSRPSPRDPAAEALNWCLDLSFRTGRLASRMPVLGGLGRRDWGLE